jgi:urea transport system permease protein
MLTDTSKKRIEWGIVALVAMITLVLMPWFNTLDKDSALYVSSFQLRVWGKYLCFAVLAMSLNLLWGYTGLLCLGQNLFFALGGYALGMHMMLMIGADPVYNSPLPDFMDFQGYATLPAHWKPFESFPFAAFAIIWVPGILAFVFGYLAFRSRIKGVYFSILTQALTYAACLLFFRNEFTFGGNNGFTDFKTLLGANLRTAETTRTIFMGSAVLMIGTYLLIGWLLKTKFGKVQQAIRDSENRVRFSGYSTTSFKLFIFTLSGVIAGLAGALYVPQVGAINPSLMRTSYGLDIVVWVAVGGRGTKYGPVIGAVLVNLLQSYTNRHHPESWMIILGALFLLVVLFMPNGIVGLPAQFRELKAKLESRKKLASKTPAEAS